MRLKKLITYKNTYHAKEHQITQDAKGRFKVGNMIIEDHNIKELIYTL